MRAFEPLLWRICVEAGLNTAEVRRLARENGLFFPPDPGAAEQSQIGGNIATNAGGPHAFKYGVTGAWVTGLEAVVPPGEMVAVGGPIRKDVAGYDLKGLLIGSEGTLGVITAAWLKLLPAPEATLPVVAFHAGRRSGLPGDRGGAGRRADRGRARVPRRRRPRRGRGRLPGRHPRSRRLHGDRRGRRHQGRGRAPPGRARGGRGPRRARPARARPAARRGGAVAVARRRLDRHRGPARREGERGHRRPARPHPRSDRGDGLDRQPSRLGGLQLGPRRRREPALDLPGRPRRPRGAGAGGQRRRGAVRARRAAGGIDLRRARRGLGQAGAARALSGRRGRSRCTRPSSGRSIPRAS